MADPYFDRAAPKSLDRDELGRDAQGRPLWLDLSPEDGAATLAAFTVEAVAAAIARCPAVPRRWLVGGGGRRNQALLDGLRRSLGVPVEPVESVGWDGDALEAEAFAYLAVRSVRGLPLSLPGTTGVPRPMAGGRLSPVPGQPIRWQKADTASAG